MTHKKHISTYVAVVLAVVVALLFVSVAFTSAHGSGFTFEKETSVGLIDVGANTEVFSDDTSTVFDFNLLTEAGGESVAFSDVWVRLVRDNTTVFATGVHNARLGGTLMTYTFPTAGSYEMFVRFQNDGDVLVQESFTFEVISGEADETQNPLVHVLSGLIGASVALIGYALLRRFRHA